MLTVWANALRALEQRINPSYYDLWIRPIECTAVTDEEIRLRAPNSYFQEWFSTHYLPIVLAEIHAQTNRKYRVHFEETPPSQEQSRQILCSAPASSQQTQDQGAHAQPGRRTCGSNLPISRRISPCVEDTEDDPFIPSFTFDTFVVGPSNQLAHAAARAASDHPGEKYNPIYIYGGVGLGKTHLLMAIGHELRRRNPSWRVVYVSCERYINEYISALRSSDSHGENKIDEFRRRYRQDCDVLLIDDIQFLAGKERTQDEFFHTFNALWHAHKQIVITSDSFPYEIDNLEERLRSRFAWGLVADIQRPDFETRVAILTRKAEIESIPLPLDVAHHIAQIIRTNIRDLEGALIRLAAYASLRREPITIDLCSNALGDMLDASRSTLTMNTIAQEVADHFHIKMSDLTGPRRHKSVAFPRQIAMYLCYTLLQTPNCHVSYPQVASFFGGRDHTTVLAACRKVERLMEHDPEIASLITSLKQRLKR